MHFKFNKDYVKNRIEPDMKFIITYFDKTEGSEWSLKYNNGKNKMATALSIKGTGDKTVENS